MKKMLAASLELLRDALKAIILNGPDRPAILRASAPHGWVAPSSALDLPGRSQSIGSGPMIQIAAHEEALVESSSASARSLSRRCTIASHRRDRLSDDEPPSSRIAPNLGQGIVTTRGKNPLKMPITSEMPTMLTAIAPIRLHPHRRLAPL